MFKRGSARVFAVFSQLGRRGSDVWVVVFRAV